MLFSTSRVTKSQIFAVIRENLYNAACVTLVLCLRSRLYTPDVIADVEGLVRHWRSGRITDPWRLQYITQHVSQDAPHSQLVSWPHCSYGKDLRRWDYGKTGAWSDILVSLFLQFFSCWSTSKICIDLLHNTDVREASGQFLVTTVVCNAAWDYSVILPDF